MYHGRPEFIAVCRIYTARPDPFELVKQRIDRTATSPVEKLLAWDKRNINQHKQNIILDNSRYETCGHKPCLQACPVIYYMLPMLKRMYLLRYDHLYKFLFAQTMNMDWDIHTLKSCRNGILPYF